jgi:hypothetical protein
MSRRQEIPHQQSIQPIVPPQKPEIQPHRTSPEIAPSHEDAPEIYPEPSPDASPPGEHPTIPSPPERGIPQTPDPIIPPRE